MTTAKNEAFTGLYHENCYLESRLTFGRRNKNLVGRVFFQGVREVGEQIFGPHPPSRENLGNGCHLSRFLLFSLLIHIIMLNLKD